MDTGANILDYSPEKPSDKPQSKGQGTYDPQAQSAAPINLSGKENFTDARFTGAGADRNQTMEDGKDKIKTAAVGDGIAKKF